MSEIKAMPTKPTRGPYTVEQHCPNSISILAGDREICSLFTEEDEATPEMFATAHLLAAAWQMREELIRVRDGLYNLCEMGLVRPVETRKVAERISRLLAKAEVPRV